MPVELLVCIMCLLTIVAIYYWLVRNKQADQAQGK